MVNSGTNKYYLTVAVGQELFLWVFLSASDMNSLTRLQRGCPLGLQSSQGSAGDRSSKLSHRVSREVFQPVLSGCWLDTSVPYHTSSATKRQSEGWERGAKTSHSLFITESQKWHLLTFALFLIPEERITHRCHYKKTGITGSHFRVLRSTFSLHR